MATASFIFSTPVAQPQQTGVLLGSPIQIDIQSGQAIVPYSSRTASGAIPGTDASLKIQLTQADFETIMGVLIARAIANGAAIPAGAIVASP
jgi:hypothetical protein